MNGEQVLGVGTNSAEAGIGGGAAGGQEIRV